MEEAFFIRHCEEPCCDLGTLEYICPNCNENQRDFSVWWEEDEIYHGAIINFQCEDCQCNLSVKYNPDEYEYIVEFV